MIKEEFRQIHDEIPLFYFLKYHACACNMRISYAVTLTF